MSGRAVRFLERRRRDRRLRRRPRNAALGGVAVVVWVLSVLDLGAPRALAQSPSMAEVLERLQRLEDEQRALRELLKAKDARVDELETELRRIKQSGSAEPPPSTPARAETAPPAPKPPVSESTPALVEAKAPEEPEREFFGLYTPGRGFELARTPYGDVTFKAYTYVRYLNQKGLDKTYTNGLGETVEIDRRDDVEFNKALLYFLGWVLDPQFRYLFYVWTNNTSQGLGAQVVLGGNLTYTFDEALTLGGGIAGLPTVRSNEGAWPYLLGVDHRTLADEFFRGSYSMGFFATGSPLFGVQYNVMVANNLSQLGVDAGQLDNDFSTVSAALWWMPTTGEFGPRGAFGDFEDHQELATRVGVHFTFSPENKQSQPNSEDPDNTQIRLANGTIIFTEGALAPGVQVDDVDYIMTSFDAGLKYHGFSLSGEYYLRWLRDLRATGPLPVSEIFDYGFQLQTSMMLLPRTLQIYGQGSHVFGDFGDPWEVTAGLNWYVFKRRELRVNLEYLYDHRSPVGYFAIPQVVGGTGSIFNANLELYF